MSTYNLSIIFIIIINIFKSHLRKPSRVERWGRPILVFSTFVSFYEQIRMTAFKQISVSPPPACQVGGTLCFEAMQSRYCILRHKASKRSTTCRL